MGLQRLSCVNMQSFEFVLANNAWAGVVQRGDSQIQISFMRTVYSFYLDAAKIALQSIFAHKLRAFLTLIGIIIGVASVVVVGASIDGLNAYAVDKISKILGANHFMIARIAHVGHLTEEEWEKMMKRNKRLDWDDLDWLIKSARRARRSGPRQTGGSI